MRAPAGALGNEILALLREAPAPGLTAAQIAEQLGLERQKVHDALHGLLKQGRVAGGAQKIVTEANERASTPYAIAKAMPSVPASARRLPVTIDQAPLPPPAQVATESDGESLLFGLYGDGGVHIENDGDSVRLSAADAARLQAFLNRIRPAAGEC